MGLSEEKVPLNPLVNHHDPYQNSHLEGISHFSDTSVYTYTACVDVTKSIDAPGLRRTFKIVPYVWHEHDMLFF